MGQSVHRCSEGEKEKMQQEKTKERNGKEEKEREKKMRESHREIACYIAFNLTDSCKMLLTRSCRLPASRASINKILIDSFYLFNETLL